MTFNEIRDYCIAKSGVTEEFPFDQETIVWKVAGKMFCLGNVNDFSSLNLKCNAERAVELREQYHQITPGWHMNKALWNTVSLEGLPFSLICELIDHSYSEVVQKLPKKIQQEIYHT